ncbi:MAG: zinc finger domain-containing protein, partial [Thermosynechococcaceae cyanobacterium]
DIGASLEAKVTLVLSDQALKETLLEMNPVQSDIERGVDELRYIFLVSEVVLRDAIEAAEKDVALQSSWGIAMVEKAEGHKCDRCWNYSTTVGLSQKHPLLCDRCETVIEEMVASGQLAQAEDGSWQTA